VSWECSDTVSGVKSTVVQLDLDIAIDKGLETTHKFLGLTEGFHTVDITCSDYANNTYSEQIVIIVDLTGPEIVIDRPEQNEYIDSSDVTVTWTGKDDEAGIAYYEIQIDQGNTINKSTRVGHTFEDLDEGKHIVSVKGVDKAGNINVSTLEFHIDTSAPSLSITLPMDSVCKRCG